MKPLQWPSMGKKAKELVLPKIFYDGSKTPKNKTSDNPWVVKNEENYTSFAITGLTPIGTITTVPTTPRCRTVPVQRMCSTPRRILRLNIIKDDLCTIDPLLSATIYLDFSGPEKRGYKYVTEHMKQLSTNISEVQNNMTNEYRELKQFNGLVNQCEFDEALEIYENNQAYYTEMMIKRLMPISEIYQKLNELEKWFILIIEPKPKGKEEYEEWRNREKSKIKNGYSAYCDYDVSSILEKPSNDLIKIIKKYHRKIKL